MKKKMNEYIEELYHCYLSPCGWVSTLMMALFVTDINHGSHYGDWLLKKIKETK
jgi:hypothetical protein